MPCFGICVLLVTAQATYRGLLEDARDHYQLAVDTANSADEAARMGPVMLAGRNGYSLTPIGTLSSPARVGS